MNREGLAEGDQIFLRALQLASGKPSLALPAQL